jgi:hypothetical protein
MNDKIPHLGIAKYFGPQRHLSSFSPIQIIVRRVWLLCDYMHWGTVEAGGRTGRVKFVCTYDMASSQVSGP